MKLTVKEACRYLRCNRKGGNVTMYEKDAAKVRRLLRAQERRVRELEADKEYLIQSSTLAELKRIEALTPEELEQELADQGWTRERLDASAKRCKETVLKALEARQPKEVRCE